jgi:hypothetical protein
MTISEDVIQDLLPLYAANECSEGTKRIVEEYLRSHPEAAAVIAAEARALPRLPLPAAPGADAEARALARTQQLLRLRTWFMALAVFFTLLPFSFVVSDGQFRWLLADSPNYAIVYGCIGAWIWIAFFVTRRRMLKHW